MPGAMFIARRLGVSVLAPQFTVLVYSYAGLDMSLSISLSY